jgi:hypothetical protein
MPQPCIADFAERGRMAPESLIYIASWVDDKLERCYQLMKASDPKLLDEWMANWKDLVDFAVYSVIASDDAADKLASQRS